MSPSPSATKTWNFSLIVPFVDRFDALRQLADCWERQKTGKLWNSELILVFDGNKGVLEKDSKFESWLKSIPDVKLLATGQCIGPGLARNLGIGHANGDFILFLDSDDLLEFDALSNLADYLSNQTRIPDIVSFDWSSETNGSSEDLPRRDYRWLSDSCLAIEQLSKHHLECSVIFSMYRRVFIQENQLNFRSGIHEDIFFHSEALFRAELIKYANSQIYIKRDLGDGLTSNWTEDRINDYFRAYKNVIELCNQIHRCGQTHSDFLSQTLPAAIASTCLKVSQPEKIEDSRASQLLRFIFENWYREEYRSRLPINTIYSRVIKILDRYNQDTLSEIRQIFGQTVSCKDLHKSVYLAPNEIRTCCKRFFVDGEIKGDVKLMQFPNRNAVKAEVSSKDLILAKRDLHTDINLGERSDCDGCPFTETKAWKPFEHGIDIQLLSMEQHSVCNLRCTYCDDTYYGGLRENYNVSSLLTDLSKKQGLDSLELVVWGGGEPVLDPLFNKYVDIVDSNSPKLTHRFLSNSLRYSEKINEKIADGSGLLVTSIDAGNSETYRVVRGRSGYEKVFINLKKYAETQPDRITIKYIFTNLNTSESNVEGFVSSVMQFELHNCFFQISSDFKNESLDNETMHLILLLFAKLTALGAEYVYLDDLIWQRWKSSDRKRVVETFQSTISSELLLDILATPEEDSNIVFWGANQLTQLLLKDKEFIQRWKVQGIVDANSDTWGTRIHTFEIQDPRTYANTNHKFFLSGVQSIHRLYFSINEFEIEKSRIFRKVLW